MTLQPAATPSPNREPGSAYATCPLCHTVEPALSLSDLAEGGDWKCRVCGQFWDAERLATNVAYKVWVRAQGPVAPSRWTVARYEDPDTPAKG